MTQDHTFHPDTRLLLAYGRTLAGRPASTTPAAKAPHVLDRLAVVERSPDGRYPLRTFGAELVSVFGRDWKDQNLSDLFLSPDWRLMMSLFAAIFAAEEPGVARLKGESVCGRVLGLECVALPLKLDGALGERLLCLFQPLGGEAFLEGRAVVRLRAVSLHPPPAKAPPRIQVVARNP